MIRLLAASLLALLAACGPALADEGDALTGTLKTINDRGTILIGYRTTSLPFSFLNKAGQPIGFSVDICHGIAEDVAKALHRDLLEADAPAWQTGVRIVYVPVAAEERLPKVVSGAVDLECGSTTANAERSKTVAFSPVFFLSGTKLMVPLKGRHRVLSRPRRADGGRRDRHDQCRGSAAARGACVAVIQRGGGAEPGRCLRHAGCGQGGRVRLG